MRLALGGVLLAQEKYSEAEPVLLSSFQAVKLRGAPTHPVV
jgi:hypothetical protein